jgi:hypothetical protein
MSEPENRQGFEFLETAIKREALQNTLIKLFGAIAIKMGIIAIIWRLFT